jgi:hypothetical protein
MSAPTAVLMVVDAFVVATVSESPLKRQPHIAVVAATVGAVSLCIEHGCHRTHGSAHLRAALSDGR